MLLEQTEYTVGEMKKQHKTVIKFHRTLGGLVGTSRDNEFNVDNILTDRDTYRWENINFRKTSDSMGVSLHPFSGDKLMYLQDSWGRLKTLYIVQNTPLPMTVLGLSIDLQLGTGA
jgi:hypothetical protein